MSTNSNSRYGPASDLLQLSAAIWHFASGPKNRNAEAIEGFRSRILPAVDAALAGSDLPEWRSRVELNHDVCMSLLSVLESHAGFEIVLWEMDVLTSAQRSLSDAAVSIST